MFSFLVKFFFSHCFPTLLQTKSEAEKKVLKRFWTYFENASVEPKKKKYQCFFFFKFLYMNFKRVVREL